MRRFSTRVVAWQRQHGRRGLPWQGSRDPYRVWLSEIMLQQTQVATALPYYARFLERFPDVASLAAATLDDVLRLWAGLGYYTRARNLHACAVLVASSHGGRFPSSAAKLARLPGIGRSTAAAIASICFDERVPILDGNAKRVLARHFGIAGDPSSAAVEGRMWELASALLPAASDMPRYTQGLMDLGATVCRRASAACGICPVRPSCVAQLEGRVDELPHRRASRPTRERRSYWLLCFDDHGVLLQQRAPVGLWGGLHVPPEFGTAERLQVQARALGARVHEPLPLRRHAFTHFTLEYVVHPAHLGHEIPALTESTLVHVRWSDIEAVAVPAPVRRLLRDMRHEAKRGDTGGQSPATKPRSEPDGRAS